MEAERVSQIYFLFDQNFTFFRSQESEIMALRVLSLVAGSYHRRTQLSLVQEWRKAPSKFLQALGIYRSGVYSSGSTCLPCPLIWSRISNLFSLAIICWSSLSFNLMVTGIINMMGQWGNKYSIAHLSTNLSVLLLALGFQVAVPFYGLFAGVPSFLEFTTSFICPNVEPI